VQNILLIGPTWVDLATGRCGPGAGQLGPTELRLLEYLARNAGQVLSRDAIYRDVWGYAGGVQSRTLDVYMSRLRLKLEPDPNHPVYLRTVRGEGYVLRASEGVPRGGVARGDDVRPPRNTFVGRQRELGSVAEGLSEPRVVTVAGLPGVGKTRLCEEALTRHGGAVCRVDLGQVVAEARVAPALAARAGLDPDAPLADSLLALVQGGDVLWLDGVRCPGSLVEHLRMVGTPKPWIVSAWRALGLRDEWVVDVRPLADDEAVALFEARCRQVSTATSDEDAGYARAIAERIQGFPLALELVAGWTRAMPLRALNERLATDLLGAGRHGGPRGLEEAIRAAWEALPEADRRILAACALFEAPFEADAVAAILDDPDVLDRLLERVEASWLYWVQGPDGRGRLSTWSVVRAFVARATGEPSLDTRRRFVGWYRAQASELGRMGRSDPDVQATTRHLRPDLLAAIRIARALGDGQALVSMAWVAQQLVPIEERIAIWRDAAAMSADQGHLAENLLGADLLRRGRYAEALGAVERAIAMARKVGDRGAEASIGRSMCCVKLALGDIDGADAVGLRTEALLREVGGPTGLLWMHLGGVAASRGELGLAEERLARAAVSLQAEGDAGKLPYVLVNQAILRIHARAGAEALHLLDVAEERARAFDVPRWVGFSVVHRALLSLDRQRPREALAMLDGLLDDDPGVRATAATVRGAAAHALHGPAQAMPHYREALTGMWASATTRTLLVVALFQVGERESAAHHLASLQAEAVKTGEDGELLKIALASRDGTTPPESGVAYVWSRVAGELLLRSGLGSNA
jgi:tetratricopeptide (TPR) repeat protein